MIGGSLVQDKEQPFVTELTDYQTTINGEIPGEVLMNVNDINTFHNSTKNEETTNCAPPLADLFLYSYENEFLDKLMR